VLAQLGAVAGVEVVTTAQRHLQQHVNMQNVLQSSFLFPSLQEMFVKG